MKIQLSPVRIVKDVVTVWSEHGPEVDIVMDLKNLTFAAGSLDAIYAFHVLDHLFPDECEQAAKNWHQLLSLGGALFTVTDDYEYITRGFVGGDITIELINERYNHPTQFTRDSGADLLKRGGFAENDVNIWFVDVPNLFPRKHYELVLQAIKKHE